MIEKIAFLEIIIFYKRHAPTEKSVLVALLVLQTILLAVLKT